MKISTNKINYNKRSSHVKLSFSYYIFSLLFIMLLLICISLQDSFNIAFAQKLSSTISLKANAGEDQYVEEGQPVILNAEDSVSSDAPIEIFRWFQVEPNNPLIDLENAETQKASFTAPNLPREQYFVFQLIVQDNNITDTDTVNIYVVEDLSAINQGQDGGTPASYQPEICYDATDNDLDGKIDLQDDDCGMRLLQDLSNRVPLESERGPLLNNPLPEGQTGQIPNNDPFDDPYFDNQQRGPLPPQQGQLPPNPGQQQQPNPGQAGAGQ
jgi:hypothetical protein